MKSFFLVPCLRSNPLAPPKAVSVETMVASKKPEAIARACEGSTAPRLGVRMLLFRGLGFRLKGFRDLGI